MGQGLLVRTAKHHKSNLLVLWWSPADAPLTIKPVLAKSMQSRMIMVLLQEPPSHDTSNANDSPPSYLRLL